MTYVKTWAGFLYLAVVTDVYSRKVVGWAFGVNMTADFVIAALNMALLTRKPSIAPCHADRFVERFSVLGNCLPVTSRDWPQQAGVSIANCG